MSSMRSIILHLTAEDISYVSAVKPILAGRAQTFVNNVVPTTITEMLMTATSRGAKAIISTSPELLRLLQPNATNPKIDDYAGSLITYKGIEFLFIDPLKQLHTVPHAKFVLRRWFDKVLAPEQWLAPPEFKWELFTPSRLDALYEFFSTCDLIAQDIETTRDDPLRTIQCSGHCGIKFLPNNQIATMTVVVPMDSDYNATVVRLLNLLPGAKAFQNGKYDHAYFFRYGSPVTNYAFDTINLFHSWYSELPKDLGFISAFTLREYVFHKNDGKTGNKMDYYEYNAKDVYYTLFAILSMLQEIPQYVEQNYLAEFPLVFPCILSEHTGLKLSPDRIVELKTKVEKQIEINLAEVRTMVANPTFNPGSWQQVQKLWAMLGSGDIKTTDKIAQDKVANRHPLNEVIIKRITTHREDAKERGSYFKDGVNWLGRCYYALNPHGTDTGRLASRESQFWCGLQIQNIKRDDDNGEDAASVKEMFIADDGFFFGEADYSQNEARGTGYLSGDTGLIAAVDDVTRDFHGQNASKFFGVPYEDIVKSTPVVDEEGNIIEWVHKTVAKALRDLSKRTNHGANYNMGPGVMLDTMGIKKVIRAKELLKLPRGWNLLKVTTHLLEVFAMTYPILKGPWYQKIINDVESTGFLVGPTGWTRRSFLEPRKNKRHLNSLVAHPPQSLAAMILNKAYMKVFYQVWMPNQANFKMHAQIHDSILFSYRIGWEHLAFQVAECMKIPTQITDTFGITRTLTVPVDLKGGSNKWTELGPLKIDRTKKAILTPVETLEIGLTRDLEVAK